MSAEKFNSFKVLEKYLPEGSLPGIIPLLVEHAVHLKIKPPRDSKFGDYRPLRGKIYEHQITINNDLNKYAFLVTLLHEIAHMQVYARFKNKVKPHGTEWKQAYSLLLQPFILYDHFPKDVQFCLIRHLEGPTASSCSDENLFKMLRKYDEAKSHLISLEAVPHGAAFRWRNGMVFRKEDKLRKRFRCLELRSRKVYLFHPLAEVELVNG
jgi:hypothetical protein